MLGVMSVVSKLVLQMNAKLGGEPWKVDFGIKSLQVIGVDVYHQGKNRNKSTVGVVASINPDLTRYYSRAIVNNEEMVKALDVAITAALTKYRSVNGNFPKLIHCLS